MSEEAGRYNSRVIQDQQVIVSKQIWEMTEFIIAELARSPVQVEHTSPLAVCKRLLGNKFLGEMEIEVRNKHARIIELTETLPRCGGLGWRTRDS